MGFDNIYRMSVILNMIDNLSGPMRNSSQQTQKALQKLDGLSQTFGNITQLGGVTAALGRGMAESVIAPVEATWDTKRALGELASLGVQDLETLEAASRSFSDQWAGTSKADFITAAYDIKSGIASLTDEGIADYTRLSGLTATATKASVGEMTSLFATGYGIYKNYYSELSDLEFGQMFSAGIADSVRQFKTTGSDMASAIQNLGASATTASVPLEEQLAVLGMLQATMPGAEAGTKYKAFLRSVAKGGEELGLSFLDANNNLKSLPEILDQLKMKFGDTMDAAEKMELQQAFGDTEAVQMIDLLYGKVGDLQTNIVGLYDTMGRGESVAYSMAESINDVDPSKYEVLKQKLHNIAETIGNTVQPQVDQYLGKAGDLIEKAGEWVESHETMVSWLLRLGMMIAIVTMACGTFLTVFGGIGLLITKTVTLFTVFGGVLLKLPGMFETLQIRALYAGDAVRAAFLRIRAGGAAAVTGIGNVVRSVGTFAKTAVISGLTAAKNFAVGMAGMARQAVTTAVTAMPGLIASVWSFTAALLANPVTWIVIAIMALIAALIALYLNWDEVVSFVTGIFHGFVSDIKNGIDQIKAGFAPIGDFFSNLWTDVGIRFEAGIQKIKDFMTGLPDWFRESGKKIMDTFTGGIMSAIGAPADAVKSGLQKIRNMLPFSDAKEGPLSTLTLSGQRLLETVSTGVDMSADLPAERVQEALGKIDLSAKRPERLQLLSGGREDGDTSGNASEGKNVVIQRLVLNVDLKEIEELRKLKKLLSEIEDYTNSNNGTSEDEAWPEPV